MQIKIDHEADAAYVKVTEAAVARTQPKTEWIIVDYDTHGNVRGIELLDVSEGVDLGSALPQGLTAELECILTEHHIQILV
jgi:uncharacterized protein YuzE